MDISSIIYDNFGRRFYLSTNILPFKTGVKALSFNEERSALSFLKGLDVNEGYWQRLLITCNIGSVAVGGEQAILELVAQQLIKSKIQVIEVDPSSTKFSQRRSKKVGNHEIAIVAATESILNPGKKLTPIQSKEQVLQALSNFSEKEIAELAQSLTTVKTSKGKSTENNREVVLQAILDGELILSKTMRMGPSAKSERLESPANIPGARPVEPSPTEENQSKQDKKPQTNTDKDQAQTLIEAAEEGDAICEDCAAEDSSEPYVIYVSASNDESFEDEKEDSPERSVDTDQAQTLAEAAAAGDAICEDCAEEESSEPYIIAVSS